MPNGPREIDKYIGVDDPAMKAARLSRAQQMADYDAGDRRRRDEAMAELLRRLSELEASGIEPTQYEVVYPLGRLATMAYRLRRHREGSVIRADTIRHIGSTILHYDQRHALLVPKTGITLPRARLSDADALDEVIFPDGTTGSVMRWSRFSEGPRAYIGFGPPDYAYRCDADGSTKFSPHNSEHHFKPRNCEPVWGPSLMKPEHRGTELSIRKLINRVNALFALREAQKIVDGNPQDKRDGAS